MYIILPREAEDDFECGFMVSTIEEGHNTKKDNEQDQEYESLESDYSEQMLWDNLHKVAGLSQYG